MDRGKRQGCKSKMEVLGDNMGKTLKDRKDMEAPKGYKNTLNEQQAKRIARREKINELFNKTVKDRF